MNRILRAMRSCCCRWPLLLYCVVRVLGAELFPQSLPWMIHFALHPGNAGFQRTAFWIFLSGSGSLIRVRCRASVPPLPTRKPLLCYVTDRRGLAGEPIWPEASYSKNRAGRKGWRGLDTDWRRDLSGRNWHDCRAAICAGKRLSVLVMTGGYCICIGAAGVHLGSRVCRLRKPENC